MTSTFVQTPATPDTGETVKGSEVYWIPKKRETLAAVCVQFSLFVACVRKTFE